MIAIRLTRVGAKKQPSYRIIVTAKRYKRDGAYIERLGHYNPLAKPVTVVVDKKRFDYWVGVGAQPSATVKRLVLGIKGTKKRAPKKTQPEAKPAIAPVEQAAKETAAEETTQNAAPKTRVEETPVENSASETRED